jgi:hypothetical protein
MDAVILSTGTMGLRSDDLAGFFVGWRRTPSIDVRLGILRSADEVVVCRAADGLAVGFATAIADHPSPPTSRSLRCCQATKDEASDRRW